MHGDAAPASPPGTTVLVIEDAPELQALMTAALSRDGFAVLVAPDGESGVAIAQSERPEVIVLDVGLPGIDGIEACRRIRTFSDAYVVMVTARDDELDTLVGLSVGADDYMTKPFSPRELVARIRAMLRRPRSGAAPAPPSRSELVIDVDAREVAFAGTPVDLTKIEFDLLAAMFRRPRHVLSRQQLLDEVWGPNWFGDHHVVEVHVSNLRRKLDAASGRRYVRTVRGVGYRFEPEAAPLESP